MALLTILPRETLNDADLFGLIMYKPKFRDHLDPDGSIAAKAGVIDVRRVVPPGHAGAKVSPDLRHFAHLVAADQPDMVATIRRWVDENYEDEIGVFQEKRFPSSSILDHGMITSIFTMTIMCMSITLYISLALLPAREDGTVRVLLMWFKYGKYLICLGYLLLLVALIFCFALFYSVILVRMRHMFQHTIASKYLIRVVVRS